MSPLFCILVLLPLLAVSQQPCNGPSDCPDPGDCAVAGCIGVCFTTPISCGIPGPCFLEGVCIEGTGCVDVPIDCDDLDPCTLDTCVVGTCQHAPIVCPSNACNERVCMGINSVDRSTCVVGPDCTITVCQEISQKSCDTNVVCETAECNTVTGLCVSETVPDCFFPVAIDTNLNIASPAVLLPNNFLMVDANTIIDPEDENIDFHIALGEPLSVSSDFPVLVVTVDFTTDLSTVSSDIAIDQPLSVELSSLNNALSPEIYNGPNVPWKLSLSGNGDFDPIDVDPPACVADMVPCDESRCSLYSLADNCSNAKKRSTEQSPAELIAFIRNMTFRFSQNTSIAIKGINVQTIGSKVRESVPVCPPDEEPVMNVTTNCVQKYRYWEKNVDSCKIVNCLPDEICGLTLEEGLVACPKDGNVAILLQREYTLMLLNANCKLQDDLDLWFQLLDVSRLLRKNCGGVFPGDPEFRTFVGALVDLIKTRNGYDKCKKWRAELGGALDGPHGDEKYNRMVELMVEAQDYETSIFDIAYEKNEIGLPSDRLKPFTIIATIVGVGSLVAITSFIVARSHSSGTSDEARSLID